MRDTKTWMALLEEVHLAIGRAYRDEALTGTGAVRITADGVEHVALDEIYKTEKGVTMAKAKKTKKKAGKK